MGQVCVLVRLGKLCLSESKETAVLLLYSTSGTGVSASPVVHSPGDDKDRESRKQTDNEKQVERERERERESAGKRLE